MFFFISFSLYITSTFTPLQRFVWGLKPPFNNPTGFWNLPLIIQPVFMHSRFASSWYFLLRSLYNLLFYPFLVFVFVWDLLWNLPYSSALDPVGSISSLSLCCILHPTNVSYLFLVGTLPCVPLLLLIYLLSVSILQLYESTLLLLLFSPSFQILFLVVAGKK